MSSDDPHATTRTKHLAHRERGRPRRRCPRARPHAQGAPRRPPAPDAAGQRQRSLDPDDWGWLWRPGLIGFLALVAIAVGGSFSNSPFKLEMPGTWFFGVPRHSGVADATRATRPC